MGTITMLIELCVDFFSFLLSYVLTSGSCVLFDTIMSQLSDNM